MEPTAISFPGTWGQMQVQVQLNHGTLSGPSHVGHVTISPSVLFCGPSRLPCPGLTSVSSRVWQSPGHRAAPMECFLCE